MSSSLTGQNYVLSWTQDFTTLTTVPAPAPGGKAKGAKTKTIYDPYPFKSIIVTNAAGKKVLQLEDSIQIKVHAVAAPKGTTTTGDYCWVADWVLQLPQTQKDALLKHEQGHYKITALIAHDLYNEYMSWLGTSPRQFATNKAMTDAIAAVKAKYSEKVIQKINDKYDDATHHDPVTYANEQATWERYFTTAWGGTAFLDVLKQNKVTI